MSSLTLRTPPTANASTRTVAARACHDTSRRHVGLGVMSAAAAALIPANRAFAAYGESANVFGRATNTTGFVPYVGDDFSILLPSRWVPSRERDFDRQGLATLLRYEDNFDTSNHLMVLTKDTSAKAVTDLGDEFGFLKQYSYLFGEQSFEGDTISEGGFAPGRVAATSVLEVGLSDVKGKPAYRYHVLVRTADGDEGGKHHLINAVVTNGNLWICKVQVGDKRWFKGVKKDAEGAINSFTV